jgi:hypothetical protein
VAAAASSGTVVLDHDPAGLNRHCIGIAGSTYRGLTPVLNAGSPAPARAGGSHRRGGGCEAGT